MDRHKTIEVLEALASGYFPTTGAKLENDSVLNEREVIQALHVAIGLLKNFQLQKFNVVRIPRSEIESIIDLFGKEDLKITAYRLADFFSGGRMLGNKTLESNELFGKYQDFYTKGGLWDFFNQYLSKHKQSKKRIRTNSKEIDFFQQKTFNKLSEKAIQQLKDKVNELGILKTENLSEKIKEARLTRPRAYEAWSEKEKELLKKALEYTNDLNLLANCFQRGKSSIEFLGKKIITNAQNPQNDSE